jgi:hypothetical protein
MTSETDIELNFGKPVPKAEERSYAAICVGIDPFLINENTPEAKTLLRWDFSLDGLEDPDQPGLNVIVDGVTSLATGPKSKMRAWVRAVAGMDLDEKVTLTALRQLCVGKPCVVRVTNRDQAGIETGYSKAGDVLPPLHQAKAATVPPTPKPATVDQPMTALPNQVDELPFS